MIWNTRTAALASLREFSPTARARHTVVRFWSTTHNRWRYCRVFH